MIDWRTVAGMARRQYGLLHFDQLRAIGLTTGAIKWSVAAGRLERRRRRIYCLPGSPTS